MRDRYPICPPVNASNHAVRVMTAECVRVHVRRALRDVTTAESLETLFGIWRDEPGLVVPWLYEVKRYTLARNVALNVLDSELANWQEMAWVGRKR